MGEVIDKLLEPVPMPKMIKARQVFPCPRLDDAAHEVTRQLGEKGFANRIKPGGTVAITAGSRGITDIVPILRSIADFVRKSGGSPFIVPSMGSHGGSTAAGQEEILRELGITEASVGAPVRSSMDTVAVGTAAGGLPVHMDKYAFEADAVIVVNKIKPHVAFHGRIESGLMKMIAIGLGKQKGAETCHARGSRAMSENIVQIARTVMENANIIFGVGVIENAYEQTAAIAAVAAENIERDEPALLLKAKAMTPRLLIRDIDALIIREMGKNISGTGMDTNVIGRHHTDIDRDPDEPEIGRIAVLDITEQSHGNANGIGLADYTTQKLFAKMSFDMTYPNALTTTASLSVKIPMVLDGNRQAVQACIRCCGADMDKVRMVLIKNTLELEHIYISESMLQDALSDPAIEILSEPVELDFESL